MSKVVKLTGRPYALRGCVTSGQGLGRQLGYPTANLQIEPGWAIPADGVYATFTHVDGNIYQSMTSIGLRPTFSGKNRTVETFILGFNGELYGREVSIDVIEKLRDEIKFGNVEELKNQIAMDIIKGKVILANKSNLIISNNKE
jgi:riboflavin kinase/FMN adenylyltransferase